MNTKALKVFFIYTIALAIFVIIGAISLYFLKSKEVYILTVKIYTITEYLLFAKFLSLSYNSKIAKKVILYSLFPFLGYSFFDLFVNTTNFTSTPLLYEFLSFIIFSIYYFYEKMKTVVLYPLYQSISFWICVGLFLYFTGNFFYLIFSNYSTDRAFMEQIRYVYSMVTISKNILLSCAFFANEIPENQYNEFQIPNDINLDTFTPSHNLN